MRLDLGDEEEATMNLTPLIDVVLFLLVFFLAASTFCEAEVDMSLTLPQAAHGKTRGQSKLLTIEVASDGTMRCDGRVCTIDSLHQKLKAAASRDKDQEVLIRGDSRTQFGLVTRAFDACLGASLRKIQIAALPEPGSNR
jgi:biopolymer transport protein ExbD